jgi:hypothetical protein
MPSLRASSARIFSESIAISIAFLTPTTRGNDQEEDPSGLAPSFT